MSFIFKTIAKNPPSILFVIFAFLVISGAISPDATLREQLWNFAWWSFGGGLLLQILWILK